MANKLGLHEDLEANLRKLADYLIKYAAEAKHRAAFSMATFDDGGQSPFVFDTELGTGRTDCGTVGCAVGHGPYAGIVKLTGEDWLDYAKRQFTGENTALFRWCFHGDWSEVDNTPLGAAKRILLALDHGLPHNDADQRYGWAPLSY